MQSKVQAIGDKENKNKGTWHLVITKKNEPRFSTRVKRTLPLDMAVQHPSSYLMGIYIDTITRVAHVFSPQNVTTGFKSDDIQGISYPIWLWFADFEFSV